MDPRKTLTEETPESPADLKDRNLTEVGGVLRAGAPKPRVLTEVPFDEDEDEDEAPNSNVLLG